MQGAILHNIYLHGSLGKTYGTEAIEIFACNTQDIFKNLVSRFGESFKQEIVENSWHITKGDMVEKDLSEKDNFMSEEEVPLPVCENALHVFPAVLGSGGKGTTQIIVGVLLIIVAIVLIVVSWGALTPLVLGAAASLAISGIASIAGGVMAMLAKPPSMGDLTADGGANTQRQSFLFNGTINNTEQGVPVPLVYGEHLVGTTIISAGMDVEQL